MADEQRVRDTEAAPYRTPAEIAADIPPAPRKRSAPWWMWRFLGALFSIAAAAVLFGDVSGHLRGVVEVTGGCVAGVLAIIFVISIDVKNTERNRGGS